MPDSASSCSRSQRLPGGPSAAQGLRVIRWHFALPSARRRPALAATTGSDGSQRTGNQPASGVVAAAGALDCASIETIASGRGFACRGAGFARSTPTPTAGRSYWRSNSAKPSSPRGRRRTGPGPRDKKARGPDRPPQESPSPTQLNAPSSRRGPRAGPWRSRPRTSSRRPRGAAKSHRCGLSGPQG
jgi:hypothetical protein